MCGIAGIIGTHKINPSAIGAMTDIQRHRGPDGRGIWFSFDKKIALGHRRLAILDLSQKGQQPMLDHSGKYTLTFNGEIYNYLELKEELSRYGSVFLSNTDSEVLLEAYKHWGEDCVSHFNGMFAFAIYDVAKEIIFCARDRFGEKPFLFSVKSSFFAFASEYKALFQLKELSLRVDDIRLLQGCLQGGSGGLDSERNTVFYDVQQLLPAESLTLNVKTLKYKIKKFWDIKPQADNNKLSEKDAFFRFRELLIDSVNLRMRSDVPVGSCLSGGLDSSTIVCIVKQLQLNNGDYHTFTGRFPGTPSDEWEFAQSVIKSPKIISHMVEPSNDALAEELPEFIWYNELPVGSTSQFAQWCVFRLAKENGITVLLDGQGADELLGGYEQYFRPYIQSLKEMGQDERLKSEIPEIWKRYPLALKPPYASFRDKLPFPMRHWLSNKLNIGTNGLYGLKPKVVKELKKKKTENRDLPLDALKNALYNDSFKNCLSTLLRYGDRNSMAHSREIRLPFCDHRLAEFIFSLPPQFLMGEVQTKRMIRESTRGIIPESIRTRWNKQGFLPPQERWFQGKLLDLIEEQFNKPEFNHNQFFEGAWWKKALNRFRAGESQLCWAIWHPFIIEIWYQYFVARLQKCSRYSVYQEETE
jgi:asparagine synthase (glutamine-hydrolysing)